MNKKVALITSLSMFNHKYLCKETLIKLHVPFRPLSSSYQTNFYIYVRRFRLSRKPSVRRVLFAVKFTHIEVTAAL